MGILLTLLHMYIGWTIGNYIIIAFCAIIGKTIPKNVYLEAFIPFNTVLSKILRS